MHYYERYRKETVTWRRSKREREEHAREFAKERERERERRVREMEKNEKRVSKRVCHVAERDGNRRRILRNEGEKRSYRGNVCQPECIYR